MQHLAKKPAAGWNTITGSIYQMRSGINNAPFGDSGRLLVIKNNFSFFHYKFYFV